jgi:two-component system chemotaxis response regulator CheY
MSNSNQCNSGAPVIFRKIAPNSSGERRRIVLLVDDDETCREVHRIILRQAGLDVVEADGATEGLQRIANKKIDLVICDLNMPKVNGLEMLKQLKLTGWNGSFPRIIMMSSDSQRASVSEALGLGVSGWLIKPTNQEMLLETVKKVIGGTARKI